MRFQGRVVLITGAGSGIGRVTAQAFAAEGAVVAVTDIDEAAATETAAMTPGSFALRLDVTDAQGIPDVLAGIQDRYGPIDVLINNAMICSDTPFTEMSDEALLRELNVDLAGAMRLTRAVLPGMVAKGSGVIVNLSSVNGVQYFGQTVYSAAKAGLISFTKAIAAEYGRHGIRCNAVAPGTIATPVWQRRMERNPAVLERLVRFYPLGRVGQSEDVADAVLFLASDQASWITGITLPVDGGLLAGNVSIAEIADDSSPSALNS
ncbi:glucose 1-dehydrogenase [Kribbella sp. NPDC051952]|uniref:SDR family NAD(P)-dependent oxidoreductase n=1 Tax=Kribbella sp. NPDC051952 TaxID=3154851 RepID=UPI00341C3D28